MDIHEIWRATFLRRWHRNPDLAQTTDTLAGHQGRVALLLLQYWPNSRTDAIHYALTHDLPETSTGDVCGQAKRTNPTLAHELAKAEKSTAEQMGLFWDVSAAEIARVNFCDKLDAYLWAKHHAPHLMKTPDWKNMLNELKSWARDLEVELPLNKSTRTGAAQ